MLTPDADCQRLHGMPVTPMMPKAMQIAEEIVCDELQKKMKKHHVNAGVIQGVFRGEYDGVLPKIDQVGDYWYQNETLKSMLFAAFAKHEGFRCKRHLGPVRQTEL